MNLDKYIPLIQSSSLFHSFSKEQLLEIFKTDNYQIETYPKDIIIYHQNQICNTIDIVLDGIISVQQFDEKGNTLNVSDFKQYENIGANLIFADKNTYPMTIVAKTDTTILHINEDLILNLCYSNKSFQKQFIKSISNNTTTISNKLESLTTKTIRQNIIDFLILESNKQNTFKVNLNMTKKEWVTKLL